MAKQIRRAKKPEKETPSETPEDVQEYVEEVEEAGDTEDFRIEKIANDIASLAKGMGAVVGHVQSLTDRLDAIEKMKLIEEKTGLSIDEIVDVEVPGEVALNTLLSMWEPDAVASFSVSPSGEIILKTGCDSLVILAEAFTAAVAATSGDTEG